MSDRRTTTAIDFRITLPACRLSLSLLVCTCAGSIAVTWTMTRNLFKGWLFAVFSTCVRTPVIAFAVGPRVRGEGSGENYTLVEQQCVLVL
jgi:hypothetical protein